MPGSSRLPVSLRDTFTNNKTLNRKQIFAINLNLARNVIFILFILRWLRRAFYQIKGYGVIGTGKASYKYLRRVIYGIFLRVPTVRVGVEKQINETMMKIERKLVPRGPGVTRFTSLPPEGWNDERVVEELDKLNDMEHARWEDGKVSGAVYSGGEELIKLQTFAFERFAVSNPIHPDVFPGVRKMEAEIVAMVLSMFNAPDGGAGVVTSGGTDSILMACLSARNKAYAERGVSEPEIILPETAHTAFLKAGEYFKIHVHLVPCKAPDYKVHIPSVSRLINPNTILLVGSAPNFPHGIIDDITALSRLAYRKSLPLHVDCCLGSFLVPFLSRAGFDAEPFDFCLRGVTSISCDTHKYGFAPKGSSVLLYRTSKLRTYQYFIAPDWPGGVYGSPGMQGSRPGALIAGCWASMMANGASGYLSSCRAIVGAAKRLEAAIKEDPLLSAELCVVGHPLVSVVAFTAPRIDIYGVADGMDAKGWHLNALQNPPAVHVAVTLPIVKAVDTLIADMREVVLNIVEKEREDLAEGRGKSSGKKGDTAALYGVAGSLPNKSVIVELAQGFLDTLYKV